MVTSGRTSLEAGTKGLQKTLHSPALGTLRHEVSLLCVGKLLFVQDGVGCEGLRLTGEEEKGRGGQCLWTQQRYTTKGKRFKRKGRFLGTCWGGGWAEAGGAAPLSCSFALKRRKSTVMIVNGRMSKAASPAPFSGNPLSPDLQPLGKAFLPLAAGTQRPRAAGPLVRCRKAWSRAGPCGQGGSVGHHVEGESLPRRPDPAGFMELMELHNFQGHSCPLDNSRNSSRRKATSS